MGSCDVKTQAHGILECWAKTAHTTIDLTPEGHGVATVPIPNGMLWVARASVNTNDCQPDVRGVLEVCTQTSCANIDLTPVGHDTVPIPIPNGSLLTADESLVIVTFNGLPYAVKKDDVRPYRQPTPIPQGPGAPDEEQPCCDAVERIDTGSVDHGFDPPIQLSRLVVFGVVDSPVDVEAELAIPFLSGVDEFRDSGPVRDCRIPFGSSIAVKPDPSVLMYGQRIGVFAENPDVRLDLSLACVRRDADGHVDNFMTRLVLVHYGNAADRGPVHLEQEIGIFDERRTKRLNLGNKCVKRCPIKRNNNNTRLVFRRLDGVSEGPVCFGHIVGIFTESGHKRLDMTTMDDPTHDTFATRQFIREYTVLEDGDSRPTSAAGQRGVNGSRPSSAAGQRAANDSTGFVGTVQQVPHKVAGQRGVNGSRPSSAASTGFGSTTRGRANAAPPPSAAVSNSFGLGSLSAVGSKLRAWQTMK